MHQHDIGLTFLKYITHTCKDTRCHVIQILTLFHDIQIIVRLHVKDS